MEMNKIFKGILQFKSTDTFTKEAGYIYLVREFKGGNDTGNAEVWFGTRKYGDVNATKLADLEAAINANTSGITANADAIKLINQTIGEWSESFSDEMATVAQAVLANKTAIATLTGGTEKEGSVAKAVADAKSALVNGASEGYDTLKGLEDEIKAVAQRVEDKNVEAEGDDYVTASAEGNKVTVAASDSTKASLALANSAVQSVVEGATKGAISVDGTEVAVHGLGSAAYTDSSDYDVSGAAATVKTELLGDAADDYNTLGKLEDKIQAVEAAAKSYEIKAITTGLGSNVKEAYGLFDEDGVQTGATINIYKDSSLREVKLSGQSLEFTYILADGTESTVGVDVSTFLAESEFKDGLQVVDGVVSVKKDASSESFLSVSENGVKVSGIQDAINAATSGKAENSVVTALNDVVTAHTGDTDIHVTTADKEKWNKAEENANTYTDTKISGVNETIATISGKVDNNTTAITANSEAISAETKARVEAVSALTDVVNTKLDITAHTAYTAVTKSVLDTIQETLSSITKDAVVSIASSGKTINVTEKNGAVNVEVNTLAHAATGQEGYVILNNVDGALYGVMYYGGDDAE